VNTKITGLVLTVAPIATLLMWFLTPIGQEGPDIASDRAAAIAAVATNVDGMKIFGLLAMVFSLFYVAAFLNWAKELNSGKLGVLAVVGSLHLVVGLAGALAEVAFYGAAGAAAEGAGQAGAAAAAAAAAGQADAATAAATTAASLMTAAGALWGSGVALGSAGTGLMMLGSAVIGVAAYVQKAANIIPCVMLIAFGLLGVYGAAYAFEETFMAIPYIGISASYVALGITMLRK